MNRSNERTNASMHFRRSLF